MIAGIGKINIDLIYSGLKELPKLGREVYSEGFNICLGGGVPATLINLSRLGVPVKLLTYLSNDMFSQYAQQELSKYGILTENLYYGEKIAVNVSAAMLTPEDRTFVSYGEDIYAQEDKLFPLISNSQYVIMQLGYKDLYRKLKANGVKLILDSGWDDNMTIESYRDYLELADYFLPNRQEAIKITGCSNYKDAAVVLSKFFNEVIIKLDSEGTYVYAAGKGRIIGSVDEFKHRDSTGAGDAFLAGFIYGLYNGYDIDRCALAGNITGGKCVTEIGCLTAYLTEKELKDFLIKYNNL